jgi:hypothetical protein
VDLTKKRKRGLDFILHLIFFVLFLGDKMFAKKVCNTENKNPNILKCGFSCILVIKGEGKDRILQNERSHIEKEFQTST